MFVIIYTPGSAWIQGKPLAEQPYFREHARYMQRIFDEKRLLLGGPFTDNTGGMGILNAASEAEAQEILGMGILNVATEAEVQEILAHDPIVLMKVFQANIHSWHPAFDLYAGKSLKSRS